MKLAGFAGLRNTVDAERLESADLAEAINIDLDDSGKPSRRAGRTRVLNIAGAHSIFASRDQTVCLFVQGGQLRTLNESYSPTAIRILSNDARMVYVEHAGKIYYSNGTNTGVYTKDDHHSWGLTRPTMQPVATPITGGRLPPGRYQYAVTFVGSDKQESGTVLAAQVDVPETGGIRFSSIPVPSGTRATTKRLYLTPANGDVLYRALEIPAADTTADYLGSGIDLVTPLDTMFLTQPIAGAVLGSYNGSILIGAGAYLYYTEHLGPELMHPGSYYKLDSEVRIIAPINDGVFIGTAERQVFLLGNDPANLAYRELEGYGAIAGTLAYVPAHLFGFKEQPGEGLPVWTTQRGIVLGLPNGQLINITESRYQFGALAEVGAALFRQSGINQYLSIVE